MALIGGFFGIELPRGESAGLAALWHMPGDPRHGFANARSALAALLSQERPSALWLPAFICPSVAVAAQHTATPIRYFPVDEALEPDSAYLDAAARRGDMVLAVDYFGRAPGAEFRRFVARRPDLLFVEDAAQALDTGAAAWANWRLHSPRNLVGVPYGGFLVPSAGFAAVARADGPNGETHDEALAASRAAWLRFEDDTESDNGIWHLANQAREAAEAVTTRPMSRLSREVLTRLDGEDIGRRRRANYQALASTLERVLFVPEIAPRHVPFGCVIRLDPAVRAAVRQALIGAGIFPAVHWEVLPSPPDFTVAHRLAAELLTLPCDQRYTPADMDRVAQVVLRTLGRR